ncbi:MAG: hypothetical protein EHM59_17445 [Betaproteobacteria bacterium]|nr:MAG: hypothetical protein EHM59_17445 [Betaproteobacteria bacterium]
MRARSFRRSGRPSLQNAVQNAVLLLTGIIGVPLGLLGIAARPDAVGIVLGLFVVSMGGVALYLAWMSREDALSSRRQ